ncbi:MAG TPA: NAD-dependent epimerase/dehydratase family protein [Pyrinomonadaceae bacterium]|nr:NAD-dependent epimerase/dehydratase family protein [Pyrinomonadaceae bacterium]
MKILILGGTVFLGRHIVDAALVRGHEVTLFNRGQQNPELYPQVEKLHGNRDGDLEALKGRRWDAVIDTSGFVPRVVRASAELLADAVELYVFVSSLSVYADFSRPGLNEEAAVATVADETSEDVNKHYGALKALSEQAARAVMPGRVLISRPGLIVGPHDPTGRFTYWPRRVAQGGEVLAPGEPARHIQFIDARDLAEWIVRMAEKRASGVYNTSGPEKLLTMNEFLDECRRVSGSDARFTWVSDEFLEKENVDQWTGLPLWISEKSGEDHRGFMAMDSSKAIAAGLKFRPLAETIRDTLGWLAETSEEAFSETSGGLERKPAGITREREAELLSAWHDR